MKRLFIILTVLFGLVASVNAEAKKQYNFTYKDSTYNIAFDFSKRYIEFEDCKFKTLRDHSIRDKNDFEADYIVTWKGTVYVFESEVLYLSFRWVFDNMVKQANNPKALVQLHNYGNALLEELVTGKYGDWNVLGEYWHGKGGFTYNPNMKK